MKDREKLFAAEQHNRAVALDEKRRAIIDAQAAGPRLLTKRETAARMAISEACLDSWRRQPGHWIAAAVVKLSARKVCFRSQVIDRFISGDLAPPEAT